jgi:4-alpha-glucanotransferase
MDLPRSAGVLLHVASLPSGRIDRCAYEFVDAIAQLGFRWWQILPISPPDETGSPYASPSTFAIDPDLVDDIAPVTGDERRAFLAREGHWIDEHVRMMGEQSLDEQVRADRTWRALRAYASRAGVGLIGDLPIYVAPDGVEQRRHPELFLPGVVAGVPPDAFTDDGQHWGNPIFDWSAMAADGYALFVDRLRRLLDHVDVIRVDHFRGFAGYWAIPEGAATARDGYWEIGPGAAPFLAAERSLGQLPLIAEDLGVITDDVIRLRDDLGYPGTRVAQFAFDGDPGSPHLPHNVGDWCALYTGTHDNDTTAGWWSSLDESRRGFVRDALGAEIATQEDAARTLTDAVLHAPARLAVIPVQDLLGFGSEARLNTPGTLGGNWRWRLPADWRRHLDVESITATLRASGRTYENLP